jgi:hypothetical protein
MGPKKDGKSAGGGAKGGGKAKSGGDDKEKDKKPDSWNCYKSKK